MTKILIAFLLLVWMCVTLILACTIIGWVVLLIPDEHNEISWFKIKDELINKI